MTIDDLPPGLRSRIVIDADGHWRFTGRWSSGNGYSKVHWSGAAWMVHRLIYTLLVAPVCRIVHLDHRCKRRWCVNPSHLEPELPLRNTLLGNAVLFKKVERP